MAALEGGAAALAVSSGQAASTLAILNIAGTGDNIVSSSGLYGGTWNLFSNTLKTMGIEVRFVDANDPESFRRATDARTRAYYGARSEERRVGKEGVSTCRSRWSSAH